MNEHRLSLTAAGMAFGLALGPILAPRAFAQASPAGDMQAPKMQPQGQQEAPLPPALPGAQEQGLQTSQSVAKQPTGDPTTQLFTAINAGDYNSAQDAIGRGADLNAQNSLGETPIDLAVALNRNSITFMLLAARNDSGDDSGDGAGSAPGGGPPVAQTAPPPTPVKLIETPRPAPRNDPGIPDSNAGFLGFDH